MATREFGTPSNEHEESRTPKQQAKLGGIFWWLILGLMIASDLGCILFDLLVTGGIAVAGVGTLATFGLGAIIALPLGFSIATLAYVGGVFLSFNASMFSVGYYFFNNVPLMRARRLGTMGVSAIIKLLPFVNMVPTLTIAFLVITFMENAKRGAGLLGGVIGKVLSKAS